MGNTTIVYIEVEFKFKKKKTFFLGVKNVIILRTFFHDKEPCAMECLHECCSTTDANKDK